MKRGRPPSSGTPQSSNKKQKAAGAATEKDEAQKEVESSPRKGLSKLPPLTEEQIKARFEGKRLQSSKYMHNTFT